MFIYGSLIISSKHPRGVLLQQEVISHKRQGPSDHGIQYNSQAPHICCKTIIVWAQEEFWDSIRGGDCHNRYLTYVR